MYTHNARLQNGVCQTDNTYLSEYDKEINNNPYVSMKVERLIM